jgi:hypothetical protein
VARLNPVITSMAIDLHMAMIQVQVDNNIVEGVILDGRSSVNIMTEELQK